MNILRDTIDLSRDHFQHLHQPLTECAWELFRVRRECDIVAIDDLKELQEANLVSPSKRIVMAHNDTVTSYAREAGFKPIIKRVPILGRQMRWLGKLI